MHRVISDNIIKPGDAKTVVRFAWVPVRVGNIRVWMEQYETLYAWQETLVTVVMDGKKADVNVGSWIKITERLITWQRTPGNRG